MIGGGSALILTAAVAAAVGGVVRRVPRSVLQLVVGVMLTSSGTFWSLEGLGIQWPGEDLSIAGLIAFYAASALAYIALERRQAFGLKPAL